MKKFTKLLEEIHLSKKRDDKDKHKPGESSGSGHTETIKVERPSENKLKKGSSSGQAPKGRSSVKAGSKSLSSVKPKEGKLHDGKKSN